MAQTAFKSLRKIKGVTLEGNPDDRDAVLRLLQISLPVASELVIQASGMIGLANAARAALRTVTALVASAAPRCNLAAPPKDIDSKVDGSGNIIYRCRHNPPHEWDLGGRRLP